MKSLFFFIWTGFLLHTTAAGTAFARVVFSAYPPETVDGATYNPCQTDQHHYTDDNFLFIHATETFFFFEWFNL